MEDKLVIRGIEFRSRLWVGTGKYKDFEETRKAIELSGADVVTVAVRRVNITDRKNELEQIYISGAEPPWDVKHQMGFMPIFYYRIDFLRGEKKAVSLV